MRLENTFEVAAPVGAAWRLLNDVPSVLPCMPGAELLEVVDQSSWKAKLHVRLGPIGLEFITDVRQEEVDEAGRRVVLAVKAREARGRGSARATIESTLATVNGGTRVAMVTELSLQGAVAQYGRGIVADVASRLTTQFAECIASKLMGSGAPARGDPAPIGGLRLFVGALWRALFRRV